MNDWPEFQDGDFVAAPKPRPIMIQLTGCLAPGAYIQIGSRRNNIMTTQNWDAAAVFPSDSEAHKQAAQMGLDRHEYRLLGN